LFEVYLFKISFNLIKQITIIYRDGDINTETSIHPKNNSNELEKIKVDPSKTDSEHNILKSIKSIKNVNKEKIELMIVNEEPN